MHRSALTAAVVLAACSGGAAPRSEPSRPAIPGAPPLPRRRLHAARFRRPRAGGRGPRDDLRSGAGRGGWDRTRYLRFGFGGVRDGKWSGRTRRWDKWSGRYRVEGTNREGKAFVTLMNLNTKQGEAWLEGKKLAGDDLQQGAGARLRDVGERHLLAAHAVQAERPRASSSPSRRGQGGRGDLGQAAAAASRASA